MELTPRQADVILVIRNWRHLHGHAPTVQEMADALHLCRGTIVSHLKAMEKKKLLCHAPNKARTYEVVADLQRKQEPPAAKSA